MRYFFLGWKTKIVLLHVTWYDRKTGQMDICAFWIHIQQTSFV